MNNYSEQDLYEMLIEIMDYYAAQRASFDPVNTSARYIAGRIQKNISKCSEDQRIEILGKIITLTNNRILENVGTKTVFYSLDGISCDLAKSTKEKKVKKVETSAAKIEQVSKEEADEKNQDEERILKRIKDWLKYFETADRKTLISLESDVNKKIISSIAKFQIPNGKANKEIIGRLNRGMYGKTKSQLITELENHGIKVNKSGKLSNIMNDDLLKYRLAALSVSIQECNDDIALIRPKYIYGSYNKNGYYKLLSKIQLIGKLVAEEYKKEYGKMPKETMIENPYDRSYEKLINNPQMILDELFDSEEEKVIKRVRRDN